MKWEDINTVNVTQIDSNGKVVTKKVPRPHNAFPLWFKKWIKRLNKHE